MKEKSCCNCKFFIPFYVKQRGEFIKLATGSCVNLAVNAQSGRSYGDYGSTCRYWERAEEET